ncbi:MAG TPA: hypothetical protein VGI10_08840 [Polyangiaceae bacterium]
MNAMRIALVGDFDRAKRSHWATDAAILHAAARLGISVEPRWVSTASLASGNRARQLDECHGIWGAPGGPYLSMQGILSAIEYARERDVPYLGTCAGFQYALIEFTRNVLGLVNANSAENDPAGDPIVITPVACAIPDAPSGTPKLAGAGVARPVLGSRLAALCGAADLQDQYFCSFETNADFVPRWEAAGLRVAARGADGEMRAFELADKRFFLATLFQPQLSSSFEQPHPIIEGYLQAAATTILPRPAR